MEFFQFVGFGLGFCKFHEVAFGEKVGQQSFLIFGKMAAFLQFFQKFFGGLFWGVEVELVFQIAANRIRDYDAEAFGIVQVG